MKENFPSLAKEIDFQEVQEAQRVPKKLDPRNIIITLHEIKDKKRVLKAAREKESYLQRISHKTISWFLKRNLVGKEGLERSIQSQWMARTYTQDYCIQQSYHLEWKGR